MFRFFMRSPVIVKETPITSNLVELPVGVERLPMVSNLIELPVDVERLPMVSNLSDEPVKKYPVRGCGVVRQQDHQLHRCAQNCSQRNR